MKYMFAFKKINVTSFIKLVCKVLRKKQLFKSVIKKEKLRSKKLLQCIKKIFKF